MAKAKRSISILLSLMMILCAVVAKGASVSAASYKTVSGNFNYSYASEVLELVNQERSKNGLKPVTMTASLTDGAMLRAAESAVSFSHTRPNGEQCFTAFEWTRAAGENIAYGQRTPAQVMNGWMNSSGHRANILSSNFTTIGIGCFEYNGTYYWAQAFSGGSGSSYAPSGSKKVTVDVSLTAGVNSVVNFGTSSATEPKTTAATTKQQTTEKTTVATTKQQTTKQTTEKTTAASTTKQQSTTKQSTTKATTTKSSAKETTTKKATTKKSSEKTITRIKNKIIKKIKIFFTF